MKFLALLSSAAVASAQLVAHPNGAVTPPKTPEVQAAEAAHFAAKGAIPAIAPFYGYNGFNGYNGLTAYNGFNGYYPGYTGAYAGAYAGALVAHPNGAVVPADTPAIAAAKNEHFAAKGLTPYNYAAPYAYAPEYLGYNGYPYAGAYAGALVAHPNGAVVPADTPAIAAAKNEHFAAKGLAPYAAPYAYAPAVYAPGYPGLVAHSNGALVPVEPADVVAARDEHLAAHASA